jgi:hypothetical protein
MTEIPRLTIKERFIAKVRKTEGCWIWIACRNPKGYGLFGTGPQSRLAHRVSYSLFVGPIPDGLLILHKCDNPRCVNPEHLYVGTHNDNSRDMMERGRGSFVGGEENPHAKLAKEEVSQIRNAYKRGGISYQKLSNIFGIWPGHLWRIVNNKAWTGETNG